VDIIEDIGNWQNMQPSKRAFLYRGMNYLIKIVTDLNYLDQFDEIIERFCFEFRNNPLAYRWGGDLKLPNNTNDLLNLAKEGRENLAMTGEQKYQQYLNQQKQYNRSVPQNVDGIDITRLRFSEEIIQNEVTRIEFEKSFSKKNNNNANHVNTNNNDSFNSNGNSNGNGNVNESGTSWTEFEKRAQSNDDTNFNINILFRYV